MKTEYIVMEAIARPRNGFGNYRKVAVCEVIKDVVPKMISMRAKGMVRIVEEHGPLNAKGVNTAYKAAKKHCEDRSAFLNRFWEEEE